MLMKELTLSHGTIFYWECPQAPGQRPYAARIKQGARIDCQ